MTQLIAAAALAASMFASPAFAVEVKPVASGALYTCAGAGLSRVALTSEPAPCCSGMLGCPQLLSNTGLLKPKRLNRT